MNAWRVAGRLILQNRWLWLLLLAWPPLLGVLLGTLEAHPAAEDAIPSLQMESLYGLVAAAFAGGMMLGQEQRSRRIVFALARAVPRSEYLCALWLAVTAPLAVYALDCALAGAWFGVPGAGLLRFWAAEIALAGATASAAILGSVFLPGFLASALALSACLGAPLLLRSRRGFALPSLVSLFTGDLSPAAAVKGYGLGLAEAALLALLLFGIAAACFRRRDLALKQE